MADDHILIKIVMKKKHVKFFKRVLVMNLTHSVDSMRMTLAFFAISGLDLLGALEELSPQTRDVAINWIYQLQIKNSGPKSGFQASTMIPKETNYQCGHIAMTYTGLATLLILGDDLSQVDRPSMIEGIKACQNADGSFAAQPTGFESDMRFVYCACCVSSILNDWSAIDKAKVIDYILRSISYDGGIGQGPGLESHGGSTFCAIASLYLMNELHNVLNDKQLEKLKRWCLMRQNGGFQGRPGKPEDTCYSFWIGATLQILGAGNLSDPKENRSFILETQDSLTGGFGKYSSTVPDPLHTYLGLCGLSLIGEQCLEELHPAYNISQKAYRHLKDLHKNWDS